MHPDGMASWRVARQRSCKRFQCNIVTHTKLCAPLGESGAWRCVGTMTLDACRVRLVWTHGHRSSERLQGQKEVGTGRHKGKDGEASSWSGDGHFAGECHCCRKCDTPERMAKHEHETRVVEQRRNGIK